MDIFVGVRSPNPMDEGTSPLRVSQTLVFSSSRSAYYIKEIVNFVKVFCIREIGLFYYAKSEVLFSCSWKCVSSTDVIRAGFNGLG